MLLVSLSGLCRQDLLLLLWLCKFEERFIFKSIILSIYQKYLLVYIVEVAELLVVVVLVLVGVVVELVVVKVVVVDAVVVVLAVEEIVLDGKFAKPLNAFKKKVIFFVYHF